MPFTFFLSILLSSTQNLLRTSSQLLCAAQRFAYSRTPVPPTAAVTRSPLRLAGPLPRNVLCRVPAGCLRYHVFRRCESGCVLFPLPATPRPQFQTPQKPVSDFRV